MSKISIIVALADDYAIGKDNGMPWHLPADLKHFKQLTTGHTVLMGRRTFESLPAGPLPNRKNIVVSRKSPEVLPKGYVIINSLEEAFDSVRNEKEIFIIGGAQIYKQSLALADTLYITWIHEKFSADTYFPTIDFDSWKESSREDHESDEKNPYAYSFVKYERK